MVAVKKDTKCMDTKGYELKPSGKWDEEIDGEGWRKGSGSLRNTD